MGNSKPKNASPARAQKVAREMAVTAGRSTHEVLVAHLATVRAGKSLAEHAEDYMGAFSAVPTMAQLEQFVDQCQRAGAIPIANKAVTKVIASTNLAREQSMLRRGR